MSSRRYYCESLGNAKYYAQMYANADDCKWNIWTTSTQGTYYIYDEFAARPFTFCRVVATIAPTSAKKSLTSVELTAQEKALVAAVLSPDEPGRDYYPGDENTKVSLWKKLIGGKL